MALEAEEIVRSFSESTPWADAGRLRQFDRIEVFADQNRLWQRVLEIHGLEPAPLPVARLVAGLEGRVLLVVTPEHYREIAPDYASEADAWTRLMAHEIAHRFHVSLLDGDEEAMGPTWFFEGFAVLVSGQGLGREHHPGSVGEALDLVRDTKSPGAYGRFRASLGFLLGRAPLEELVSHASRPDFEDWLRSLEAPR